MALLPNSQRKLRPCTMKPLNFQLPSHKGSTAQEKHTQKLCLQGPCEFRILFLLETSLLLDAVLDGREEICQLPHCHILSSRKLQTEPLLKKPHGSPFLPRSRAHSIACIKESQRVTHWLVLQILSGQRCEVRSNLVAQEYPGPGALEVVLFKKKTIGCPWLLR
ncbi:unnamed protein product [Rangifer tarandus platyrhynchus]|uniref:Uncharacterized protein n=1 Tax=Rangifer tarandus platyrhynchus TaxID=3082113 RepID=A0AC59ZZV6_RANTA